MSVPGVELLIKSQCSTCTGFEMFVFVELQNTQVKGSSVCLYVWIKSECTTGEEEF